MKIVKEKLEVVAEDGKVFVGENAIKQCCEYEKEQLKKQIIQMQFDKIKKEKVKVPLFRFFTDEIEENNYVFWIESEKDIEVIKKWWQAKYAQSYIQEDYHHSHYPCMIYTVALGNELYLRDTDFDKHVAYEFCNQLSIFENNNKYKK